ACAGSTYCEDFFMGEEASCEAVPSEFPTFKMKQAWASANGTAATWSRASVGDIDGDGVPEIIVTNRETSRLFVLNGADGSTKQQINLGYQPEHEVAMADFEGDGLAEFVVSGRDRSIEAYTYNGTQFVKMWGSNS